MDFYYSFPAVKGKQANREYYIAMVPLKMLKKIFQEDNEYVLPEYRAQRKLNEARVPEIKNYIINNADTYVFSALAASIDGEFVFAENGHGTLGMLEVSMDAKLLINDGQHRKAAILAAIEEKVELGEETIAVVFYEDRGLQRSQQMFTDLNKHAVKASNSISELYDSRDQIAVITRGVIGHIPFLNEYVDKEKDILGKFSSALFTLNMFYNANKRILGKRAYTKEYEDYLYAFWRSVVSYMIPWKELVRKEISKVDLREQYIASQSIVIQALGRVGNYLFETNMNNIDEILSGMENINWKRSSDVWKNRVIRNDGRVISNEKAILLLGNVIKKYTGIELTDDEKVEERKLHGTKNIKVGK